MRKVLLVIIVALLTPVFTFAQNKALTKPERTNLTRVTEERLIVPAEVVKELPTLGDKTQWVDPGYTVSAWVKMDKLFTVTDGNSQAAQQALIFGYTGLNNCNVNGCWNLVANGKTGKLQLQGWGCQGAAGDLTQDMPLNEWVYLTVVVDNAGLSISVYQDGELLVSRTMNGHTEWFDNEEPALNFMSYGFIGAIDEIHVFTKPLSAAEVAEAYKSPVKVDNLAAWYTLNEIVPGTTGQFANMATSSPAAAINAYHETVTVANSNTGCHENGLYYASGAAVPRAESAPQVVDGRVVDYSFTVPAASDYENVAELTFTAEGETLTAGETVSLSPNTEITINVVAAEGYQVANISINGVAVENGGTFTLNNDTTKDDIVITLAQGAHALAVVNAEELSYTLTTAAGAEIDLAQVLEGTELRLTVTVPEDKVLNAVRLGDEVLTANAQGVYVFTMPASDVTLTIDATPKAKYTVTYAQPNGGTLTVTKNGAAVASGSEVLDGTVLTVATTANAGYTLVAVKANGATLTSDTYTVNADVTFSAEFEEGIEYCEPTPISGRAMGKNTGYSGRGITSLAVSCGENSITVAGQGTSGTRAVYADRTSNVLTVEPGSTVTITASGTGTWMNTFIFVDFDKNGFTNDDRVYRRYSSTQSMSYEGTASFGVPSDLAPGKYRLRYMVDWDGVSPCQFGQSTSDNGEVILDFLLSVPSQDYENARTITVAAANDLGTVAITNPATDELSIETTQKFVTIKATANEGAAFINWTDEAGQVVSETATYEYSGEEAATFTASFGYVLSLTVKGEGKVDLTANDVTVANGEVVLPGSEVIIAATPDAGKALISVSVNGEFVSTVGGVATITVDSATEIVVEFGDKQLSFEFTSTGDGTVYAYTDLGDGEDEAEDMLVPAGTQLTTGSPISTSTEVYFFIVPNGDATIDAAVEMEDDIENDVLGDLEYDEFALADGTPAAMYSKYGFTGDYSLAITFSEPVSAIDSIAADGEAGEIEFFNLQGVKVGAGNLTPGIYVVRHGETTAKVLVK